MSADMDTKACHTNKGSDTQIVVQKADDGQGAQWTRIEKRTKVPRTGIPTLDAIDKHRVRKYHKTPKSNQPLVFPDAIPKTHGLKMASLNVVRLTLHIDEIKISTS